ncbi:glycosyltransferase [Polaribacter atrinae]|uniref:glycosyltransferase n=1 Tax=Polaribacter atrinae TaxID=1333662 RepID=UPI0030F698B8
MKNRICCIFNFPSHYRTSIFELMDQELNCDFYFADSTNTNNLKKIDYSVLRNFKKELKYYKVFGNWNWMRGAVGLLRKPYKAYFLIGEPYCISTWFVLFIAKLLNKKTYLWSHGWYGKEGFLKTLFKKAFFNQADKIFLYGNYAKELMINEGFDDDKLVVIYNSLNYESQLNIRKTLKTTDIYNNYFKNDSPVLIYIGRIQKVKRLDLLIEAMKVLKDKNIETNLVVIGGNNDDKDFINLINNVGLKDNVWLHGPCYDERVIGEFLYNANVCVSPGNVGLTAMHSFAYGTPVITHNNFKNQMPEFEAIKPGVTGDFFKENDVHDLSLSISKFINVTNKERELLRTKAFEVIDLDYNPRNQIEILKKEIILS